MNSEREKIVQLPSAERIEEDAAEWFARLRTGGFAQAEIAAFEAWRAASDRHARAFEDIEASWRELGALEELEDLGRSVLALGPEKSTWYRRRSFIGMAATLAAVTLGAGVYFNGVGSTLVHQERLETAVGEQKTIALPDGSTIQLNTDGVLVVDYVKNARNVRLTKGEAYFSVARDSDRPFTVLTDNGSVTAVGTEFTVRLRADAALEVTVAEGRVALTLPMTALASDNVEQSVAHAGAVAELTKGQIALFHETIEKIAHVSEAELNRKLSWRQGMLAYSGESLEEVIADVSRYTVIEIEIVDPQLKEMLIQGYFKVGETEALFEILELTFGIEVERVDDGHVRLLKSA